MILIPCNDTDLVAVKFKVLFAYFHYDQAVIEQKKSVSSFMRLFLETHIKNGTDFS